MDGSALPSCFGAESPPGCRHNLRLKPTLTRHSYHNALPWHSLAAWGEPGWFWRLSWECHLVQSISLSFQPALNWSLWRPGCPIQLGCWPANCSSNITVTFTPFYTTFTATRHVTIAWQLTVAKINVLSRDASLSFPTQLPHPYRKPQVCECNVKITQDTLLTFFF